MKINSKINSYEVGDLVAENETCNLYICTQEESGRQCLLQIAKENSNNGDLDRSAFLLTELERYALEAEEEYMAVKEKPESMLNYQFGFPELVESFIFDEQDGRRVNILAFRNVPEVSKMVPLINITEKDGLRVDLRTSAWIVGKLLKLLVLVHSKNIAVRLLIGDNILIEPNQHYVLIFDWLAAQKFPGGIPDDICREEISEAVQAIITVCGGDPETGIFLDSDEKGFEQYVNHLQKLALGSERSAQRAHERHYEIVDGIWEHGFHPFTTHPLTPN